MPLNRSSQSAERAESTIYAPQYLATTLGMFVLVFLVAFESMAVTTVTSVRVRFVWSFKDVPNASRGLLLVHQKFTFQRAEGRFIHSVY
ncbi:hypothetical protein ACWICO_08220 [Glutamicibacter sp. NPDC055491]